MNNDLTLALDRLWEGTITYFHHDLLNHRLDLAVMVRYNDSITNYKICIDQISSIVFDDATAFGNPEYDNFDWEIMEVTSFNYYPGCDLRFTPGYAKIPEDGNLKNVGKDGVGAYNLLIEIFETGVYIHAKRLRINDQAFQLL